MFFLLEKAGLLFGIITISGKCRTQSIFLLHNNYILNFVAKISAHYYEELKAETEALPA